MTDKVYMTHSRSMFVCPKCSRKTPVSLSDADACGDDGKSLKCVCGYSCVSSMERRRHTRKRVNFKGRYRYSNEFQTAHGDAVGRFIGTGKMDVVDVSAWGLKIKLKKREEFRLDDRLFVEFRLDDDRRTFIQETAAVKNVSGSFVGGAFVNRRRGNRNLGFYLLG